MKMKITLIVITCLAVATPAFCKKKGKGGKNQPEPEAVVPSKPSDSSDAKPATDTPPPATTPQGNAPDSSAVNPPPPLTGELTTLSGKKYETVALKRIDPDGLSIVHKDGAAKVMFIDLSEELRIKYGYDVQKAAAFQAAQKTAQTAQAERQAKEQAAEAEKQAEEKRKAKQHAKFHLEEFVVNQVINKHEFIVHIRHDPDARRWLITKNAHNVADNELLTLRVAPTGNTRQHFASTYREVAEEGADVKTSEKTKK